MEFKRIFSCSVFIGVIIGTQAGSNNDATLAAYPVRNETRTGQLYSKFKRVYVEADIWKPDFKCLFKPRLIHTLRKWSLKFCILKWVLFSWNYQIVNLYSRTKVECAGCCLANSYCIAFRYYRNLSGLKTCDIAFSTSINVVFGETATEEEHTNRVEIYRDETSFEDNCLKNGI